MYVSLPIGDIFYGNVFEILPVYTMFGVGPGVKVGFVPRVVKKFAEFFVAQLADFVMS